eukprot:8227238-Pyramimonas_sp.AAC.2
MEMAAALLTCALRSIILSSSLPLSSSPSRSFSSCPKKNFSAIIITALLLWKQADAITFTWKGRVERRVRGPTGEQWERVGNWTQGEKRGRVSGVLRAPLPLLAQEDP